VTTGSRLYADENVDGAIIRSLLRLGWDVIRAIDQHPPGTSDEVHFAAAARDGRMLLTRDRDMVVIATEWQRSGQVFARVLFYAPARFRTVGQIVRAIVRAMETPLDRSSSDIVFLRPGE
jgi:hypothetical protein